MELLKEKPGALFVILGLLLCCIVTAFPLVNSIRYAQNYVPPAPLSEIVLQLEDINVNSSFEQTGQKSDCNVYLLTGMQNANSGQAPIECYQVKFKSFDNTIVVLNAIWVFENSGIADLAFKYFAELDPSASNIKPTIVEIPSQIGESRSGSTFVVTGGIKPMYLTNLYWKRGSAVVRLTAIGYKRLISVDELIPPAQRVASRLDAR
jgi:hypothetical protein